jgi:hypothetical protein
MPVRYWKFGEGVRRAKSAFESRMTSCTVFILLAYGATDMLFVSRGDADNSFGGADLLDVSRITVI